MKIIEIDWLSIRRGHWESRVKIWTWKMLEKIGIPEYEGFSELWEKEKYIKYL